MQLPVDRGGCGTRAGTKGAQGTDQVFKGGGDERTIAKLGGELHQSHGGLFTAPIDL
jgi:hypothetical protein